MPIYKIPGIIGTHNVDEIAVVPVGRISKGEKQTRKTKGGKEYEGPVNLDYFNVKFRDDAFDLMNAFNEEIKTDEPRSLRVQLAYPDLQRAWFAWQSVYKSGGMLGLNDGIWWNYLRDPDTNDVLVSDYMLTSAGLRKIQNDYVNGYPIGDAQEALEDYVTSYHREGLKLPRSWKKVEMACRRGKQPRCLFVDDTVPVYITRNSDGEETPYFSKPEGRLFVTMPHIPKFTSQHMLVFKTGSSNDIRTLSQNLAGIAEQVGTFDNDLGKVSLSAIPMVLVRRLEEITKNIGGKMTRGPEWLVHLRTLSKWQTVMDEIQLHRNVKIMMSTIDHELGGLSQTIHKLEIPEVIDPMSDEDEIETGAIPEIITGEVVEDEDPGWQDEQLDKQQAEKKPEPPKQQRQSKAQPPKQKAPLKPREASPEAKRQAYDAAVAALDDQEAEIGPTEFWSYFYGMGYTNSDQYKDSEDWRACLEEAVENWTG